MPRKFYRKGKLIEGDQADFHYLMNAPARKSASAFRRRDNYCERDFHISFGSTIKEQMFCMDCRKCECNNTSHDHRILHSILRVPKQTAGKVKWKQFFAELNKFSTVRKQYSPKNKSCTAE